MFDAFDLCFYLLPLLFSCVLFDICFCCVFVCLFCSVIVFLQCLRCAVSVPAWLQYCICVSMFIICLISVCMCGVW